MWMEANNKVYGITCNPYDTRRLVGGSSGGEGAATAACFAAFGLGSDVGGSIRMPAFFNGVYGYKASAHLIPNRGQHPGARGQINHLLTTGPLCRFAEDLLPVARVIAEGGFLEDPVAYAPCPPLPLKVHTNLSDITSIRKHHQGIPSSSPLGNVSAPKKKLRVFAITDFGLFLVPVAAAEKKAVLHVAAHLEHRYGAEVTVLNLRDPKENRPLPSVEQLPEGWDLFKMVLPMWTAHMTHDKEERTFIDFMSEGRLEHEPLEPYREFIKWIFGRSAHTAMSVGLCVIEKTDELFNMEGLRAKQLAMGYRFRDAIQRELGDDAIIVCPTYPIPAPKHHEPTWKPFQWLYTAAFNVSQSPSVNVPVWDDVACGSAAPSYEAARMAGLPADHYIPKGVQIVSGWGNDALALSVAAMLDRDGVCGFRYPSWVSAPDGMSLSPHHHA
ncbi:amidase-like protein, putative [Bodo saltans]|uniref:Amidase-like protein, putative n=1 Tax=Bodo saltans TaxID=75058 RepID=A0A0S4JR69_BODSA|nr:amidase-like protein, putative [Bodo saltans]|eukprot:CUG93264.1 amidase-like protein, putative [Bodo saltans]